jgi:hypothetical protein
MFSTTTVCTFSVQQHKHATHTVLSFDIREEKRLQKIGYHRATVQQFDM